MCDPGGVRLARDTRPLMPAVEALNTQLRAWGVAVPDVKRDLALAYENSVLYSEHTWGGGGSVTSYGEAFQKLPPESYRDLEGSWEDKADYIRTTVRLVRAALETNLAALAQAVDYRGPRVLVYNALPWPRSGVVEVAGRSFLVENVPASGYKTVPLPPPSRPTTSAGDTLENELFKVKLDPARGRIASLVDKRLGPRVGGRGRGIRTRPIPQRALRQGPDRPLGPRLPARPRHRHLSEGRMVASRLHEARSARGRSLSKRLGPQRHGPDHARFAQPERDHGYAGRRGQSPSRQLVARHVALAANRISTLN